MTTAITYRTNVIIIGGLTGASWITDNVWIIDTNSDSLSLITDKLNYSVAMGSPIIFDQVLYVFGGYVDAPVWKWQYYDC